MSKRPIIEKKKARLIRSLNNTPPAWIDLIDYVKLRTRCTTGTAKKILLSGALKIDSHPVGFKWEADPMRQGEVIKVLYPYLDAKHRGNILIQLPEELKNA